MNIILCGPGRSGTTLLNQLFSFHPEFSWISGWVNHYPKLPHLSFFNQVYQSQLIGVNWAEVKFAPKPAEAYGFWRYYFPPFTSSQDSVDSSKFNKAKTAINNIKQISKKPHFVTKITGETRARILNPLFNNDLIWVWIERDPRVVVSSYIKQKWGYKDDAHSFEKIPLEEKIRMNCNRYLHFYEEGKNLDKRKLLFYEDLCNSPEDFFKNLLNDLRITYSNNQQRIINEWKINPVTWEDYKHQYSNEQQKLMTKLLKEPLETYGYI